MGILMKCEVPNNIRGCELPQGVTLRVKEDDDVQLAEYRLGAALARVGFEASDDWRQRDHMTIYYIGGPTEAVYDLIVALKKIARSLGYSFALDHADTAEMASLCWLTQVIQRDPGNAPNFVVQR